MQIRHNKTNMKEDYLAGKLTLVLEYVTFYGTLYCSPQLNLHSFTSMIGDMTSKIIKMTLLLDSPKLFIPFFIHVYL